MRFQKNIHRIQLLWGLQKQDWWNVKNENAVIIIRTVFVVTSLKRVLVLVVLALFLHSLQNDCLCVDLLKLSHFGNLSGSGPKEGYKRVRSKNISDTRAKRTKSTKQTGGSIRSKSGTQTSPIRTTTSALPVNKRCEQVSKRNG